MDAYTPGIRRAVEIGAMQGYYGIRREIARCRFYWVSAALAGLTFR